MHIQWLALLLIDMFPRTTVFQKWPKNPLTCFHVQMVSKMANRHQFYQLEPLGNRTTYEYDKAGRLTKVTDAMGVSTRYGYDKAGNKLYMTDGRGKTTSYTYGAFGKLRMMTDAEDRSIIYSYDLSGNLA